MTVERAIDTWSDTFKTWSKPLSDTEEATADRAASIIRDAIGDHPALADRNIEVYGTGSYRNNTNVRGESDIDVAVVCHDSIFFKLPEGAQARNYSITTPASYSFETFRTDVNDALFERFGSDMTVGDKTFTVHENTYRMEADVTPFFEYRLYDSDGSRNYGEGVQSISASGKSFVNWHHDHYKQGVKRNTNTGKRFKRVTRILKNVKFDIIENGTTRAKGVAEKIPSFLVECLVFNAPDTCFDLDADGYVKDLRCVIADLWERTKTDDAAKEMVEVNRRKWLFRSGQAWKVATVHEFLGEAWGHLFSE